MTFLVPLVMFAWVPVVLVVFATMRVKHRAVIAAYLIAWLFLPMAGYPIPGLPDYTKMNATSMGLMLAVMLFDSGRLTSFRLRWFDLPMLVWCLVPFASAVSNDIGGSLPNALYGGLSIALDHTFSWGLPYLIGRLYFVDLSSMRDLAIGIVIGGLIYVPLCLYEVRMSPQLHKMFYGFHAHSFAQTKRFGGFRPTVFMQHGLAVGLWMTTATLVAFWLWRSAVVRRVANIPMGWVFGVLLVTSLLVKSTGALALLLMGIGALVMVRAKPARLWLVVLLLIPVAYGVTRTTGVWQGEIVFELAAMTAGEDRADSFAGRLINEDLLIDRALQRPFLGWSGWDRSSVYDDRGQRVTTQDGMWIIALGQTGIIGLIGLYGVFLIAPAIALKRLPPRALNLKEFAPPIAMTTMLLLAAQDFLLNAMPNPIFMLMAGCSVNFALWLRARAGIQQRRTAVGAASGHRRTFSGLSPSTEIN